MKDKIETLFWKITHSMPFIIFVGVLLLFVVMPILSLLVMLVFAVFFDIAFAILGYHSGHPAMAYTVIDTLNDILNCYLTIIKYILRRVLEWTG